jgi:DNA polymerase I - 3''-5'' exonuclease and polymerase domains
VEFDFDGYHLRLLCDQINYPLTIESAHKQLAKHYFGTEDITEEQYKEAKQINFHAIYGKIPKKHKNLEVFKLIKEFIDNLWKMYEEVGVVCDPISGKPFTEELKRMNPAKLMNYLMQSLETSRNILILKEVLRFLKDKKTKVVLYTYDSVLFDFSKEEKNILDDLENVLSEDGKYPVKFKFSENLVL